MFIHSEVISRHGSATGILPRFLLQMQQLWGYAFDKVEYEKNTTPYVMAHFLPAVETLYYTYHEILNLHGEYMEGLITGKYYKRDDRGHSTIDRSPENTINQKVKEFFMHSRLTMLHLYKSQLVQDIDLSRLFNVKEIVFEKNVAEFMAVEPQFKPIFDLIEKSRNGFLSELIGQRAVIEHDAFQLNKYKFLDSGSNLIVTEPGLDNIPFTHRLQFYYENLLDMLEKILVYYYGIRAKKRGMVLHVRSNFDYSQMKYKYIFQIPIMLYPYPSTVCQYD